MQSEGNFDIPGFCVWAKVSRRTTYNEIKNGRLIARKIGRRTIITPADALSWRDDLPVAA